MRNPIIYLLFLVAVSATLSMAPAVGTADEEEAGTVSGRVLFQGGETPKGVVVSDVVVYLEGDGLTSDEADANERTVAAPVLNQRDLTFEPHVLPVVAGTKVRVRNEDAVLHNVHSASGVTNAFNRASLPGKTTRVTFKSPEVIPVLCDIHSQMLAYILVLPNPFFTKAEKDATYTISGVPPGKYKLVAWHEKYGTVTGEVEVEEGGTAQVDVDFQKALAMTKGEK